MGARSPPLTRTRRGGLKCEFCTKVLNTSEQLRTHQLALHPNSLKAKEKGSAAFKKPVRALDKSKVTPDKVQKKDVKKILIQKKPISTTVIESDDSIMERQATTAHNSSVDQQKIPQQKIRVKKLQLEADRPDYNKNGSKVKPECEKRVEFKCPLCVKRFPVCFSALKHVQRHHGASAKGSKVAQSLQPILEEICNRCNMKYMENHKCTENKSIKDLALGLEFYCNSCEEIFSTVRVFDAHVASVHNEGLENMFFPTEQEFITWKNHMESETGTKYTLMGKYNQKQVYRCRDTMKSVDSDIDIVRFCPSTVVVNDYNKGLLVHYYTQHCDHFYKPYSLKDKYKSYSLTDLLNKASGYDISNVKSDDNDLYMQFKKLMESIILDAAKINIDALKNLIGKALEMTSVLTSYDEDADTDVVQNTSIFSLKLDKKFGDEQVPKALEGIRTSQRKRKGSLENNVPAKMSNTGSPILQKNVKNTFSLADNKDSVKILQELEDGNGPKSKVNTPESSFTLNAKNTSFNDSYRKFIENNKPVIAMKMTESSPRAKRQVVKTKIGLHKPNFKRKERDSARDIKYEVKERDDECNILILKI